MPESLLPETSKADLHRRIDAELRDGGHNTAATVRLLLHGILDARVEAPADWATPAEE
jgi:hypothetical protein